jgi:hypothetical protein
MPFWKHLRVGLIAAVGLLLSGCTDYFDLTASSHDCAKHPNVQIRVSAGAFAISGPCEAVLVSGNGNRATVVQTRSIEVRGDNNVVAVEAADDITISNGAHNSVTYENGLRGSGPNCVIQGSIDIICERHHS